jgi:hypothetical protein
MRGFSRDGIRSSSTAVIPRQHLSGRATMEVSGNPTAANYDAGFVALIDRR